MPATKPFMHSAKSGATARRSTKPDVSRLARVTDLPVRDDARSNGGGRARQEAMGDNGYPDWNEDQGDEHPDGYFAGDHDADEEERDYEDGEEEEDEDSFEEPEPTTPKGKASRPESKGKARKDHRTMARAKARQIPGRGLGHSFTRSSRNS